MRRLFQIWFSAFHPANAFRLAGTAGREEFWTFCGVTALLGMLLSNSSFVAVMYIFFTAEAEDLEMLLFSMAETLDAMSFNVCLLCLAAFVLLLIPSITLTVRRYHDVGLSNIVFLLVFLGTLAVIPTGLWEWWKAMGDDFAVELMLDSEYAYEVIAHMAIAAAVGQFSALLNFLICMLPGKTEGV